MTDDNSAFVIAVVDDDESILRSLEYLLQSADYASRLFTSAAALLASGSLQEIHCLISDIDMPDSDGFDLLREVQRARPGLPAILITGYPERLKLSPPAGGSYVRFFTKPFPGPAMLAAVSDAVRSSIQQTKPA